MRKLFLLASQLFGGGAVVAVALGCLLACQQPAKAAVGSVVFCAIPPSCPTVSCDLTWFGDGWGTCTATVGGPNGDQIIACNCN
jgi:hypothetical protein